MISSLIALLNLIFAFFLSARISLYLHRNRINKLESPLNLFLKSTIQVVNRLRGVGATKVLCMFLINFASPNFHSKENYNHKVYSTESGVSCH